MPTQKKYLGNHGQYTVVSARAIAYGAWRREVMFTHFIWLSRVLLSTKTRSALEVKSRLPRQRILSQLGNDTEEVPLRFMGQDVLYHQPLSLD